MCELGCFFVLGFVVEDVVGVLPVVFFMGVLELHFLEFVL